MKSLSDLTAQCIRCGFCIETCPTFAVTGNEAESPRGRIRLIEYADQGVLDWNADVRLHIDNCLGCRACETACPSGVRYGEILELARERFEQQEPRPAARAFVDGVSSPRLLRLQLGLGALLPTRRVPRLLSKALAGAEPEADSPRLPNRPPWPELEESGLPPVKGEVFLLTGCAMGVLYPDVHEATKRLLRRVGWRALETGDACCGALHAHQGYLAEAQRRGERLAGKVPEGATLVVNSAGCGSTLRDQGFARAVDASVFLLKQGLANKLAQSAGLAARVTYHDACHLAHGQGVRREPRELLRSVPGLELVALRESEMCCGSAGVYNVLRPKMARTLLERKWANIAASGATMVATGNPGCLAWIEQAAREHGRTVRVFHTLDLLEASFSGLRAED